MQYERPYPLYVDQVVSPLTKLLLVYLEGSARELVAPDEFTAHTIEVCGRDDLFYSS